MRTTLEIDDDVLAAARAISRAEGVSLGTAVSRLAHRGLASMGAIDVTSGFPTFAVEFPGTPITLERVNENRD